MDSSWRFRLGPNAFQLKASLVEKPQLAPLTILPQSADRQALFQALATGTLLEGRWTTEGELAYSLFNSNSMEGFGDPERRRLRLALKTGSGDFRYGAEFRMVGKEFTDLSGTGLSTGERGWKLWAQQKFGALAVEGFVSRFSDNLDKDPALPRFTRIQTGTSLRLALPCSLPYLSLSYSHSLFSTFDEPISFLSRAGSSDIFGASLVYRRPGWEAKLASTLALTNTRTDPAPSNGSQTSATGMRTQHGAVSLGLVYQRIFGVDSIALSGSYEKSHTNDRLTDAGVLNTSTSLSWKLGQDSLEEKTLSLQATHTRRINDDLPDISRQDVSVRLLFAILVR